MTLLLLPFFTVSSGSVMSGCSSSPGLSDSLFLVCFSFCLLFVTKELDNVDLWNDYDFNLNDLYFRSRYCSTIVGTYNLSFLL